VVLLINFLQETFVDCGKAVSQPASALARVRAEQGGPPLAEDPRWRDFLKGVRHKFPAGSRFIGLVPFPPWSLVECLPTGSDFMSLRLRALVLLRVVTMCRPGEPASIALSTVQRTTNQLGESVVVFHYRSKNSNSNAICSDSNFVEFLSRPSVWSKRFSYKLFCPATQLLELVNRVLFLHPSSQSVFTSKEGRPLSADSCASLVTKFMRSSRAIDQRFTAHSLRSASQQMLIMLRVPARFVNLRAGWSTADDSATRVQFYTRYRFVPVNFANCLVFRPGTFFRNERLVFEENDL